MNVTQDEYAGMAGDARYLQVPVAEGKRDKVGLVQHLPAALRFVAARLLKGDRVLVHCAQGRDRSVGVAIAVLATCFDEDLALDAERCAAVAAGGTVALDRGRGKERLCRLLNVVVKARPRAEPSRATMKKQRAAHALQGASEVTRAHEKWARSGVGPRLRTLALWATPAASWKRKPSSDG